ncbi:MAG TPA: sulfotransferase [Devosia sp.]|nr:sulfotransferase [Devosia sp.]
MTLEVIGPGFGRTGTNSLQLALQHLGFGPCHHMHEVGAHPELLPAWDAVSWGGSGDWNTIFRGYRSQVDWPGARVWRELAAYYPKAKVVLTVRDPDEWFTSFSNTIVPFTLNRHEHPDAHGRAIALLVNRLINQQIFGGRMADREHAVRVFLDHIEEVKATVPPERLLVFDVKQGWEPLCRFLEVPVPDMPFPRVNTTREFNDPQWKAEAS